MTEIISCTCRHCGQIVPVVDSDECPEDLRHCEEDCVDIAPHEWQGEPCPGAKMAPTAYQEEDDWDDDDFNVLGDVDPEDREGDWDYNTEEYDLGEPTP